MTKVRTRELHKGMTVRAQSGMTYLVEAVYPPLSSTGAFHIILTDEHGQECGIMRQPTTQFDVVQNY